MLRLSIAVGGSPSRFGILTSQSTTAGLNRRTACSKAERDRQVSITWIAPDEAACSNPGNTLHISVSSSASTTETRFDRGAVAAMDSA
jgi:hypothetical protein